jgi:hypothetical protein
MAPDEADVNHQTGEQRGGVDAAVVTDGHAGQDRVRMLPLAIRDRRARARARC